MWSQPTHGDRIGLAVQRLNHSATLSVQPSKYELSFLFRFWFQSILIPVHPWCTILIRDWLLLIFIYLYKVYLETFEEIFEKNLMSSHWKKFALLKEKYDSEVIRTHARRPYWVSSPTPLPLGDHVCTAVEVRNIIAFSFLISFDSNRPVDAHFWSEIDYCWFFSYLDCLFGSWWKTFLTEKLIGRLWTIFFVIWKNGQRSDSNPRTETVLD